MYASASHIECVEVPAFTTEKTFFYISFSQNH